MLKKILITLLACAAVMSFASCDDSAEDKKQTSNAGNTENQVGDYSESNTSDGEDGEEIDYLSDLSKERYDGYNFRILTRKTQLSDQYLSEDSADIVESATYRRNRLVEDMYGITITGSESSSNNYDTDALNAILAGDDAYDIIFTHARAAFNYAIQGAAYNINEISTIHLDKPWWTQDIAESCSVNGRLFVLDGDITSKGLAATMCLLFNKQIFDDLGFDYPYQMVKDGDWTFDEFAYLVKKGGADLDGDGVIEPEKDRFGFVAEEWQSPINILYAGGQKIYDKADDGSIELSLYSNKTVEIFDEYFSLMNNSACQLMVGGNYGASNAFREGRAMFKDSELQYVESYRDMDDSFGILPYPKFDESDDYTTASNGGMHLMIIPITVKDVERTGAITEALCSIGSRDVIPTFYEKSLKTKYSRDDESKEMIDIIRDSRIFDLGYVAGGTYQSCGKDLASLSSHDFASYYAKSENSAKESLKKFNKEYAGIE